MFIGSHGGDFQALDAQSGAVKWVTTLRLGGRPAHVEGAAAAAAGAAATVYVGAYCGDDVDGPRDGDGDGGDDASSHKGCLFSLCAATGALRWRCPLPGEIKATPLVVPTAPHTSPASEPDGDDSPAHSMHYAGPCETSFVAVGAYDGRLYLVNDGGFVRASVACGGSIYAGPTLLRPGPGPGGAATVVVCTTRGGVVAVACAAGGAAAHALWTYDAAAPVFSTPLVCGDRVIFGAVDGTVRCLTTTATHAEESWRNGDAARPVFSSPALVRRRGPGGGAGGPCCVYGAHDGWFRGVCVATGAAVFAVDLGCVLFASPAVVGGVGGGGPYVVVATTAGDVHLLVVNEEVEVVGTVKLAGEVYSSPVVVGGRDVYIGCRDDCCHRIAIQWNVG